MVYNRCIDTISMSARLTQLLVAHREHGAYVRRQEFAAAFPSLMTEWDRWLKEHLDPGHCDAYKERDPSVLPYIDGHPQWVCDEYLPPHLCKKALGL